MTVGLPVAQAQVAVPDGRETALGSPGTGGGGAGAAEAATPFPGMPAAAAPEREAADGDALLDAASLDAALRAAHARDDRRTLVGLYAEAAAGARGTARAFHRTQAYVFALDTGDPCAPALKAALVEIGADIP
ncbi:MAG: hypothetical protein ACOCY0_00965 [Roseicyclus sp.]